MAGYEQADRYLSLMKKSDEAFAYLLDYFSRVEEPTMIVMFGDHQAAIENGFYEALYGKPLKELTAEEADKQYVTPFIIWTNYELESQEIDKISANYLGAKILETANLELTDYDKLLLKTWDSVPALTKMVTIWRMAAIQPGAKIRKSRRSCWIIRSWNTMPWRIGKTESTNSLLSHLRR